MILAKAIYYDLSLPQNALRDCLSDTNLHNRAEE